MASITPFEKLIRNSDFNLRFRKKIDDIFRTAIQLGMPFLSPESPNIRNRHPLYPDGRSRFAHLVQLEWFDNGTDQFHIALLVVITSSALKNFPHRKNDTRIRIGFFLVRKIGIDVMQAEIESLPIERRPQFPVVIGIARTGNDLATEMGI